MRELTNARLADLRAELRSWGKRRRTLESQRDPLVRRALAAHVSIEEIHQSMGIARTTIDRIGKARGEQNG